MIQWIVTEHAGEKFFLEMPHRLYYDFVRRSFIRYQELAVEKNKIAADTSELSQQQQNAVHYEHRLAMNDILVYGALSLEAYINYYAMRYHIPFYHDLERSLSTLNKWKIYPTLKTRRSIDKGALDTIKKIFKLRDEIVHPKPERIKHGSTEPTKSKSAQAHIESEDKGKLIIDLNSVFEALFKIDDDEKREYKRQQWMCILEKVER